MECNTQFDLFKAFVKLDRSRKGRNWLPSNISTMLRAVLKLEGKERNNWEKGTKFQNWI